ncbi:MAG: hypothetical protein U0Y10_02065 [Spirosomataceae bacterium]
MKLFYAILLGGLFLTFVSFADTKPTPRRLPFPSKTLPIRWVEDKASLDCIRLGIKPSADSVKVGEELTLTITAEYTTGLENLAGYMGDCQDFTLQLVLPQGFEQTGGDYHDLLRINLSPTHKTATLTLTGKFTTHNPNACFLALRGSAKADANSLFIKKAQWCTKTYCSLTPEQITANVHFFVGNNTITQRLEIKTPPVLTQFQYSIDGIHFQDSFSFEMPSQFPDSIYVREINTNCIVVKSTKNKEINNVKAARTTDIGLHIYAYETNSRKENPDNIAGST